MTKSETSLQLIRNAIRTPDGTLLISRHRHDYKTYKDTKTGKEYMVDGGLDYQRRSAHGDEEDACLYNDEPHDVQRQVIVWGSYGKHGDQPLRYIPIAEMETAHIAAVLTEMPNEKLRIKFTEEYYDCSHSGCSGGEFHVLQIFTEDGTELNHSSGGCFGSDMYDQVGAIKAALELLGYQVEVSV